MKLSKRPEIDTQTLRRIDLHAAGYKFRTELQLRLWQQGQAFHNDIDNECCPDFSCCRGRMHMASQRLRDLFVLDPASRRAMMEMFIGELPDAMRILYDLPGQVVFTMQSKQH